MRPITRCALILASACSGSVVEPATQGDLRIDLPATSFTVAEVRMQVIRATVRNTATAPRFTRSQDGFGNVLMTASGSDAAVERMEGSGGWTALPAGVAIEGLATAVLQPDTTRELWADLSTSPQQGTYRIRLRYGNANTGLGTSVAYSATFTVR